MFITLLKNLKGKISKYITRKQTLQNGLRIGSNCIINSPRMLEVGENCSIGPNCVIYCIYKKIILGNNVLIGPNVTMVNGDHNIRRIGIPIIKNQEKELRDDAEIIVEDDVWIGANATILKGVKIGRGAVIAAGAIITKSVLPYCIVGGINKTINIRFNLEEILEHEKELYPLENRLTIVALDHIINYTNQDNNV